MPRASGETLTPSVSEDPLDAATVKQHIEEVAAELSESSGQRVLVIAGGALLAWHGLRDVTNDVDCVTRLDDQLRTAVHAVAQRRGLAPRWLNDAAVAYLPATFQEDDCTVMLDHPALLVLGAPLEQVFLMKLFASRARDTDDLEVLWRHCAFESPEQAADAFHQAYPHLEPDENLADLVRNLG